MLRNAKTGKVSVLLAGLLLAASVLFTGGSAQAASKPAFDLQAPLGGEVFAPGQEILIRVAPQGSVINITVELDIYDSAGTTKVSTVSLGSISNVKPTKFKLHQTPFTLPSLPQTGLPSSHCRIRLGTVTKLGLFESESGDFIIGSPGLLPNSVDNTHIIDGEVKTADIGDGEVTSADILDGGVATGDIANNAVTGAKLLSDATDDNLRAVNTNHLKDVAVTNAKIANGAVDANKLASDAVTTVKILDNAVTTAKIADGNVTLAKLPTTTAGRIIIGQNAAPPSYIAMNGDATIDASGLLDLANLAVETSELANDAVTTAKILDLNVTTAKLANGAVTTGKIGTGEVQASNIATNAVDTSKIANGTILAEDLETVFNASLHRQTDNKNVALVGNAGGTIFLTSTANSTSSGAFLVGVFDEFDNSNNTNVQGVLNDLDAQLTNALGADAFSIVVAGSVVNADSPGATLTLLATGGLSVAGNDGTNTVTIDLPDDAITAAKVNPLLAGDGLFLGGSPEALHVGETVGGAITVNNDDIGVTLDGIDGTHLADNITVDGIVQEWTFPSNTSPSMTWKFTNKTGAGTVELFRIERSGGTALFTVNERGEVGSLGLISSSNGVNVSAGSLTTGSTISPTFSVAAATGNTTIGGTLTVTGGLSASSLASDGDFTLDIDKNNDGGSANFTVRNNNAETIYQLTVSDAVSVTGSLGTTAMPGRVSLSDGSSNTGLLQTAALAGNRTYTFPDQDGTVAMISDITNNVEAAGTSGNTLRSNGTKWVNNSNFTADGTGNVTLGNDSPSQGKLNLHDNTAGGAVLGTLQTANLLNAARTYTLPDASGTVPVYTAAAIANGGLLIGNTTNNNFSLATLTAGNSVSVGNAAGAITLNTIQDIRTTDSPAFAGLTLGNNTGPTQGTLVLNDNAGTAFAGSLQTAANLTAARTYTLPDTSGTVLLANGGALSLGDNTPVPGTLVLNDNNVSANTGTIQTAAALGANRTYTLPDVSGTFLLAAGGALTLGDDSVPTQGSLVLHDNTSANTFTGTILTPANLGANATYTLPSVTGTLARIGDITSANFSGTLSAAKGGTGLDGSAAANGSLLIGNGTGYTLATLTGTSNQVNVANAAGGITLSTPQSIAATSSPTFAGLTLGDDTTPTAGALVFEDDQNGNTFQATLKIITGGLTTDQTFSLPNTTGTLAVTTDITAGNLTGVVPVSKGGTGVNGTALTDGQLLIGNDGGDTFSVAALTGTADQVTVTNGAGSITLSTPQSINTTSSPTFAGLTLTGNLNQATTSVAVAATGSQAMTGNLLVLTNDATADGDGAFTLTLTGTTSGKILVVRNEDSEDTVSIAVGAGTSTVAVSPGFTAVVIITANRVTAILNNVPN